MPIPRLVTATLSTATLCLTALPAFAGDITISDAYARASSPTAKAGAAFMMIENSGDTPDRLISVTSDAAARVELHTHSENAEGVMQMRPIEGGIDIANDSTHALARGGDHVMFMGLTQSFEQDSSVSVTFTFEQAGEITIDIPVDLTR